MADDLMARQWPPPHGRSSGGRCEALDAMRGMAVAMVVARHYL